MTFSSAQAGSIPLAALLATRSNELTKYIRFYAGEPTGSSLRDSAAPLTQDRGP